MKTPEIDSSKLNEVKEHIDRACDLMEKGADKQSPKLRETEERLRKLTNRPYLDVKEFREYWGWTSLDDLAETLLMPEPEKSGMSVEEIAEVVTKICNVKYSESETDYQLKRLKLETGLDNITDYIFNPNEIGLDMRADTTEIIAKILEDRK